MNGLKKNIFLIFCLLFCMNTYSDNFLPETKLVSNTYSENSFPLITADKKAIIFYDQNDYEGVIRAIIDLQSDIEKVTSLKPGIYASGKYSAMPVIIGTAGRSKDVDRLIETGKINSDDLKNKWESFVITVLDNPFDKVDKALVIAGSDKRGTIYGIYERSKQLGVSPWYWWGDVPVKNQKEVYVNNVSFTSGEPKVRYR